MESCDYRSYLPYIVFTAGSGNPVVVLRQSSVLPLEVLQLPTFDLSGSSGTVGYLASIFPETDSPTIIVIFDPALDVPTADVHQIPTIGQLVNTDGVRGLSRAIGRPSLCEGHRNVCV